MNGRIRSGLLAGAWGVLGMAGTSFTMRRLVEPGAPIGKTHYESVIEHAHHFAGGELSVERRIRLGEVAHLAFGAMWGAVLSVLLGDRSISTWRHGAAAGSALWLAAFSGYMPALGISRPLWRMKPYEFLRTWVSHVAYATTTLMALRSLRSSD